MSGGRGVERPQLARTATGSPRPGVVSVARAAGVSPATVSNTYNRPESVSPELRERVLRAAAELGYGGGDPAARSLRGRRAGAIGVVLRERLAYAFDDPAAIAVLRGVSEAADDGDLALVIVPAHPGTTAPEGPAVRHAAVDGLVLYSLAGDDPLLPAVRMRHLPTVAIDSPRGPDAAALGAHGFVGIDERAAGDAAVTHLLALGHRRIGFVSSRLSAAGDPGPVSQRELTTSTASVATGRLRGARDAMTRAGLPWNRVTIVACRTSSVADGDRAARQLLDLAPEVSAVVALADVLALGVLEAAATRGLAVPADLSVVGFDDVAPPDAALTTVAQPHRDKGRTAADLLLSWVADGAPPPHEVLLPTALVVRDSTGSPR